jgi:CO dehydrogenase/acetyl-CoA synthase beta subunit
MCSEKDGTESRESSSTNEAIPEEVTGTVITREDINQIKSSLNFLSDKYDTFLNNIKELKDTVSNLVNTVSDLKSQLQSKDSQIGDLQKKIITLEQKQLEKQIEITGIYTEGDDSEVLTKKVIDLVNKIQVSVDKNSISDLYVLPKSGTKPRKIIVELANKAVKQSILYHKKKLNDTKISKPYSKVYINESLTYFFRQLLWQVKTKAQELNFKFVWYKYGKILVRRGEGTQIIKIQCEKDLSKLE